MRDARGLAFGGDVNAAVTGFGHLGDSNIHLNILCDAYTEELATFIAAEVYEFVRQAGGSVSAEHGIGFLKRQCLQTHGRPAEVLEEMRTVKGMMDPAGILNPYKVLS